MLKLPLWLTIKQAYGSYLSYFPDIMRAAAAWVVIVSVVSGGTMWLQVAMLPYMLSHAHQGWTSIAAFLLPYLAHIVLDIALMSIAVAWHRRIIIDEQPAPLDVHLATTRFWRNVSVCLGLFLISLVVTSLLSIPFFAVGAAGDLQPRPVFSAAGIFGLTITIAVMIGVACRLLLLLPAVAIDDRALSFRKVWQVTRGNTWRLFWGTLICSVLPVFPKEVMGYIVIGSFTPANLLGSAFVPLVIFTAISAAYNVLAAPILAGFLSYAYRHFFGSRALARA